MKAIVINAGPKRKGISAQLAKSAAKGAESNGFEVEYIDLYKLDFNGCMTCLICKQEGKACRCWWRDDVSGLIEKILNCDTLIVAAPIFFSHPTSHYMALLERLIFCIVSFKTGNTFKGKVNVGLFYVMEYPKDYFENEIRPHLKISEDLLGMLNGEVVIDSFNNITQDEMKASDDTLKQKEDQLNHDLEKVYEIALSLTK